MAETIQGQKLLAEIRYVPKYGSKDLSCRPLSSTLSGHMLPVVASPNFYLALTFQVCNGIKRLREYIKCSDRAVNNEVPTKISQVCFCHHTQPQCSRNGLKQPAELQSCDSVMSKVMVLIELIFLRQIFFKNLKFFKTFVIIF